ncbi:MAG: hypothetical protein R3321_14770 [Nitrososphaeraceae archaeon]|nr:hypothetical protein [Nitrososphaeraceae archaeon]
MNYTPKAYDQIELDKHAAKYDFEDKYYYSGILDKHYYNKIRIS